VCSGYGRETGRQALKRDAAHHQVRPISRCWVIAPPEVVQSIFDVVAFAPVAKVDLALHSFPEMQGSRAAKATDSIVERAGTGWDVGKLVEPVA